MHRTIEPAIHYWGTPVVLLSTVNEDGSSNLAPMSSAWWLGWSAMLGLDASSHSVRNLRERGECVMNLAGIENAAAVDALALTTGSAELPPHKRLLGYRHVADKFEQAGLTPQPAQGVRALRVAECPVQLEARVARIAPFGADDARLAVPAVMVELRILRVHVAEHLLRDDEANRVDAARWRPLIMSFRELHGLGERVRECRLARAPEAVYAPWRRTAA